MSRRKRRLEQMREEERVRTERKAEDELRGAGWTCAECGHTARLKEEPPAAWKIYDWGYPESWLCKRCVGTGLNQVITWQLTCEKQEELLNKILMTRQGTRPFKGA